MAEVVKRVKEEVRGVPRRGLGYGMLRYLRGDEEVARRLRSGPEAEVSFNYLGQFDQLFTGSPFQPAKESSGPWYSERAKRRYLLFVPASIVGDQFQITFVYSKNLHKHSTIQRLAEMYIKALREIIANCESLLTDVYTPSDFPLAELAQEELEGLIGTVEFEE